MCYLDDILIMCSDEESAGRLAKAVILILKPENL